ncbi:hypothetical protein Taro_013127 [Colocasia esculenta]|uniref:PsbP C-terminal domain-containing protein n=1 Tax=Colocasia esculenta TaxID=4460 RepID=A0A843UB52_COLES|nr:hypothetical protein [Colocasia esculenta]
MLASHTPTQVRLNTEILIIVDSAYKESDGAARLVILPRPHSPNISTRRSGTARTDSDDTDKALRRPNHENTTPHNKLCRCCHCCRCRTHSPPRRPRFSSRRRQRTPAKRKELCGTGMGTLQSPPAVRRAPLLNASVPLSSQPALQGRAGFTGYRRRRRCLPFRVRAEASPSSEEEHLGRRQMFAIGALAPCGFLFPTNAATYAAETKKGFQSVSDTKDGYSFLYPFGWQEVVVQGQDKVFKDVIEPLESVSVNLVTTSKQDIRDLGAPKEVAEALVRKVLAPSTQKTKVVEASEHEVDGKTYYQFEFIAQAPNFTRHALGAITIGNGKFYTLTTGANERRWEKIKDRLHTVVDSFKIVSV